MKKKEESLKEFIVEAEEILDGLNQNLLVLESSKDGASVPPDVINSVFRAAHTLKGMSGMVGLKRISELSHRLEDLLDRLRMGKLHLSPPVTDTLFAGVEGLRKLVEAVNAKQGEKFDTGPILKKIEQVLAGEQGISSPGASKPKKESHENAERNPLEKAGVPVELAEVLTEYESHRLIENIKTGRRLYEVHARFSIETFDRDLTRLNSTLSGVSEIVTTLPSSGMSPDSGIEFNLIVATAKSPSDLKNLLVNEAVEIFPLRLENDSLPDERVTTGIQEDTASIKSLSQTVRVDIGKLDSLLNVVGELVQTKAVLRQFGREWAADPALMKKGDELQKVAQSFDRQVTQLQEGLIDVRMIPIGQVFDRLARVVRRLSKELSKEVNLRVSGEDTRLDKSMVEEIADPLMHLILNAIDHGIEPKEDRLKAGKPEAGTIQLKAAQKGNSVVIEVQDDGRGIDLAKVYQTATKKGLTDKNKEYQKRDLLNFLFIPGFSTTGQVTEVSGRGVGLDVVAQNIAKLSGMVDLQTEVGQGTRFSIMLPITLVIIKALIIKIGEETYAIPLSSVSESMMIDRKDIRTVDRREVIQLRDQILLLLRLHDLFQLPRTEITGPDLYVIVAGIAEKRLGLLVDAIEGQQEIVVKSIGGILRDTPGIAGATELGNRKTVLVLDVGTLIKEATQGKAAKELSHSISQGPNPL